MKPKNLFSAWPALIAALLASWGGQVLAEDDATPPPPYVLADAHGVVIGVTWEESGIRNALPKNIRPVSDMAGGIVIYKTGKGYGLGSYTSAYLFVNVEGYDSREGTKANWMLQGIYGPNESVPKALSHYYKLPVRTGVASIEQTADGHRYVASISGKTLVSADVRVNGQCSPAQAFENYPAIDRKTGEVVLLEIPEVGEWCDAEVTSISLNPPAGDPFAAFKIKSVNWAGEFKDWSFSFTNPIITGKP